MSHFSEYERLIISSIIFEDLLGGIRPHVDLPKLGEPGYPLLLSHLLFAISHYREDFLTELYSSVPENHWRNVCDYGRQVYFNDKVRKGELTLVKVEGGLVHVVWRIEAHNDRKEELEDALAEALSGGMRLRDIVDMAKRIEEKLWHEQ